MDAPIESLPSRPVRRDETDTLEIYSSIDAVFPVFGHRPELRNKAFGLVIASDGVLYGVAYDGDAWFDVDQQELDGDSTGGVHPNDMDTVETMQDSILDEIGVA